MTTATFHSALAANKARVAALLAFRSAPSGMVSIKGVDGTHRVTNTTPTGAWCVKQVDGADRGASRWYEASRLTPVA